MKFKWINPFHFYSMANVFRPLRTKAFGKLQKDITLAFLTYASKTRPAIDQMAIAVPAWLKLKVNEHSPRRVAANPVITWSLTPKVTAPFHLATSSWSY
jgi:hypothetical protein